MGVVKVYPSGVILGKELLLPGPRPLLYWFIPFDRCRRGVMKLKIDQADYPLIAKKREIQPSAGPDLTQPENVRAFVEDVITNASFAFRADPMTSHWDLVAPGELGHVIAVRLEKKGYFYKVATALTMEQEQIGRKIRAAVQQNGVDAVRWRDADAADTVLELSYAGVSPAGPSEIESMKRLRESQQSGPKLSANSRRVEGA